MGRISVRWAKVRLMESIYHETLCLEYECVEANSNECRIVEASNEEVFEAECNKCKQKKVGNIIKWATLYQSLMKMDEEDQIELDTSEMHESDW